jgi:hypothetical protein
MELTPLFTEIGGVMHPLLAANRPSDELATITPRLGWFGAFFDAIGKPEFDTVGLTTWMTTALIQGRGVTYLNNLVALFPDHKFIQTIAAGYHYQDGKLQLAIEACERARNAEETFEDLEFSLMFYAAATLGSREAEVDKGIHTRANQRNKVAEWSEFLATTASKRQFDPSLDLQVYLVWAVLLKNGFPAESLAIAERESERTDLEEPQRNRWRTRAELSNECNTNVSAFADTVKQDPRFSFTPQAADTKVP